MKFFLIALLSSLFTISSAVTFAAQGKVTGGIDYELPDWFKESFLEIAEDAKEAEAENKHVMLFMHLNGCPYCNKMITENFAEDALKPFLLAHFDSIGINILGDREIEFNEETSATERNLAQILNVKYTPTMIFLNADNKTVLRLNGYRSPQTVKYALEYVQSKAYLKTSFNAYKNAQKSAPVYTLNESPLYTTITDFSTIKTPVALMFEDKTCDECSQFHRDTLAKPEIQQQFKRYTFVRLDAESEQQITDFNGKKTTPKKWVEALKLSYRPGIVLFDEQQETARIESMLYPFHFESVLRFGLDKNYQRYNTYLDLMGERTQQLIEQGINVNVGAM